MPRGYSSIPDDGQDLPCRRPRAAGEKQHFRRTYAGRILRPAFLALYRAALRKSPVGHSLSFGVAGFPFAGLSPGFEAADFVVDDLALFLIGPDRGNLPRQS